MLLDQSHVRRHRAALGFSLYCMVTADQGGKAFFKFGVSSSPTSRIDSVQTGCPVRIVEILFLPGFSRRAAQNAEREIHSMLAAYRSSGEWFCFDLADLKHKADFNAALKYGCKALVLYGKGSPMKWVRRTRKEIEDLCEERQAKVREAEHRLKIRKLHRMANGSQY